MNNRGSLNLKYVIWGQRIWTPSRDAVAPWTKWRAMEDRGDITQNHWYVFMCLTLLKYVHSHINTPQGPRSCQLQRLET